MTKEEYNSEPVHYCSHCLSLKVLRFGSTELSYCDECGSMDVETAHIDEWSVLYQKRYGKTFL